MRNRCSAGMNGGERIDRYAIVQGEEATGVYIPVHTVPVCMWVRNG